MEVAIGAAAARWAVGKALSLVTDGLLESWTASSKLGPNVRELKMELLYAQGMLNNARGWDVRNRALDHLLLELRNVAYNADDVLDELEYFRIQDELDGTYDTTDTKDHGLVGGLLLNARHTARAIGKCLGSVCSCCGRGTHDDDDGQQEVRRGCMDAVTKCFLGSVFCSCCGRGTHDDDNDLQQEARRGCMDAVTKCLLGSVYSCCGRRTHDDEDGQQEARRRCMDAVTKCLCGGCSCHGGRTHDDDLDQEAGQGCMAKVISSAHNTAQAVGKRIPCTSLPRNWCSKAQQRESVVPAPKLKFDRVKISQRMKDIVEQLKPLCAKVATILDLEISGHNHTVAHNVAADRRKTTPDIVESKLYGRDDLKRSLVDEITHSESCVNNLITVVSIVGPGGIGKTTLTQHIYQEVRNHFHVSWIYVTQNFSACTLEQYIVNKIPKSETKKSNESASGNEKGSSSGIDDPEGNASRNDNTSGNDNKNGNAIEEKSIQSKLQSKRVLLVLDDMWTYHEDEWEKLLGLFKKVGTTGNVVIVTTRIPKVAEMVATRIECLIRLERLEYKYCMSFFQACVFGDQQSWNQHDDLHTLGDEIVKKLKGFPLAVKTVSRLLRNKLTLDHWRRVLESKEWEHHNGDDDILPALKLSYNYLSFDLQQCFSHCALFPEDYEFGREELIHFWIGLGLLDNCDQNNKIEDLGSDYLDALIDHGFFQKSEIEDDHPKYLIHDLLHELAVSVSANECLSIHGSNVRSIHVPISIRHLSISIDNTHVKDTTTFENFKTDLSIPGEKLKVENLRTLMLFGQYHGSFYRTFRNLFGKAKSLRVILLSGASYDVEDLLPNFSHLIHLRYLRIITIPHNEISLPSSIPKCYHLMVLDIEQCYCDSGSLGGGMRNLVKLRHFVAPSNSYYSSISEVGKLKSLQKLSCFEVNKKTNGFKLKQLGQLRQLKGSLRIENLERVEDVKEAEEAKLVHMNHLHGLGLHWEDTQSIKDLKQEEDILGSLKDLKQEGDILESLKPHSYLREISIEGHRGTSCPSWLGEYLSVSHLEFLRLNDVHWKTFPPQLCMNNEHVKACNTGPRFLNLKRIELDSLRGLKRWCGNENSQLFSCLVELKVSGCSELLELPFSDCNCNQAKLRFLNLQKIQISDCPKLLLPPPISWTIDLHHANISLVGMGIKELNYDKKSAYLRIDMGNVDLWDELSFDDLGQIEQLIISNCPPMPLQRMQKLKSLKTLHIEQCTNVLCPIEGDSHAQYQFQVEFLKIFYCNASGKELTQLISYFTELRRLFLIGCKNIAELGVTEKQTTEKLAPLPSASACQTEEAQQGQRMQQTRTEETEIKAVDGEGLLLVPREKLTLLWIKDCRNLRLCPGTLDDSTEGREEGLQGLHSLTSLHIQQCPNFFSSFAHPRFPDSLQSLLIYSFKDLTGEGFWELLPQGRLTELTVIGCHKFFTYTDTEPSRLNQQDLPPNSRPFKLSTKDIAGVLTRHTCARLSPFLTRLVFCYDRDTEHFTKAQESALQTLTLLQELEIRRCDKLLSLPASLSGLPNLKRFQISSSDSIQSIPKDWLPSSLTELRISHCKAIRSIPKGSLPSSLQDLEIIACKGIRSLPKDVLPGSLRLLNVSGSDEELRRQCRKLKGIIPIVIVKADAYFF